jgi:hypothetical protein
MRLERQGNAFRRAALVAGALTLTGCVPNAYVYDDVPDVHYRSGGAPYPPAYYSSYQGYYGYQGATTDIRATTATTGHVHPPRRSSFTTTTMIGTTAARRTGRASGRRPVSRLLHRGSRLGCAPFESRSRR